MKTELIKQAIESAKCRIYKLNFDLEGNLSAHHQKKANNQKELMEITVEALEKQIPKKPLEKEVLFDGMKELACVCSVCESEIGLYKGQPYCENCGNKVDWEEGE